MVPEGWKLTTLGEVCDGNLKTGPFGSQLHADEYTEIGIPVLMPKDLLHFRANLQTAAKISQERAKDLEQHKLESGNLLFSRRGDVARFALIDKESNGSLCGTGCLRARPSDKHSSLFLSYFLQKNAVKKWLEQNAVGQTMPNMNTAILSELPLIVASSKAEEEKIAQILSTWDKAITTTEQLLANSQQQKKALMQQLLTGKKWFPGFRGEWKKVAISDISDSFSGGTPSRSNPSYYGGKIPWIKSGEVNDRYIRKVSEYISSEGLKNSSAKVVPYSAILVAMYGATAGKVGINFVRGATINQAILAIIPKKNICDLFLFYLLELKMLRALDLVQGGQPNLNAAIINSLKVPIPDYIEQKKIASVLSAADREIEILEQKIYHLKQEKKALMQQLLTGKRRVKLKEAELV